MSNYIRTGWNIQFFQSPNCIFDVEELNAYEKLCYLYLCRCADDAKQSFPSYNTIAKKIGASRRTAINTIKKLELYGFLTVEKRRVAKKKNASNIYTLIHPYEVIHNGAGDAPEQMNGGAVGAPRDGAGDAPNKDLYSFKNIPTDRERPKFVPFDWVNK